MYQQNQRFTGMPPQQQTGGMPPSDPIVAAGMPPQGNEMPPEQNQWSSGDPTNPYSPWSTMPPDQANYDQMQGFSDQAYDYSRRYVDPQQDQDQRRIQQEMVNKGIDPNSAQGMEMMNQMSMRHGDQNDASAFGAMGFGQGIQNQMFNQQLGWGNLELGRQQQDFGEILGYDQIDYRNDQYNEMNNRWDQSLAMNMAGYQPPYGSTPTDGSGTSPLTPWSSYIASQGNLWR
jgi:hypothetical protein